MPSYLAEHQHIAAYLGAALRSLVLLGLLIAFFAPLESFFAVKRRPLFAPGWSINLGWYFLDGIAAAFLLGPPTALLAWATHSLIPSAITGAASSLPIWAKMCAAMVVGEIGFYWGHRWSHEWPLLWRFHAVHHSAVNINFLVNTRAHPVDLVFTRLCGLALLYVTGLASPVGPHPDLLPAIVLFVGSMWSYFIHANLRWRLGLFEEVLASPAFHHWHHTYEDHKDHNYASMLPVLDRVFGTFYLPDSWPEAYGTSTPMPDSITGQLIQPFATMKQEAPHAPER